MTSFRQFRTYPLQSLLIVLAVALGVAVVTAVVATLKQQYTGYGDTLWQRQITLQTKKNDWNVSTNGEPVPVREIGLVNEETIMLTLDDLARAKEAAPSVDYAYIADWNQFDVTLPDETTSSLALMSVTPNYFEAVNVELSAGSFPTASDYAENRQVILLSEATVRKLELAADPVGQTLTVLGFDGNTDYTVVGVVVGDEQQADGFPNSFAPYAPMPWETDGLRELIFAVKEKSKLAQARAELQSFAEGDWGERVTVRTANDADMSAQQRLITLVIAAFASTALAAASLNITNLMLARVLKRQHDIGIQRSLGATQGAILRQFLTESLTLGVLGGALGTAAGYGLYRIYNAYQVAFYGADMAAFLPTFPWQALPIGLALALATSLVFGFYPAWQASRLHPVQALREV